MRLDYPLTPYTKISSTWIKDLNVRPDTIKLLLEKNIGRTLSDINQNSIFFFIVSQNNGNKNKQMGPTEIFCTAKERISKTKNHPHIGRKYL